MTTSRIVELANTISSLTKKLDQYLQDNDLPQPSFDADGPWEPFPGNIPEIDATQIAVVEAALELKQLLQGPSQLLCPPANISNLAAIHHFQIAQKVPINGEISFSDLAAKCGLPMFKLRMIVRFAIAHHRVFQEPRKGFVAHSAASRMLAENPGMQARVGINLEEGWPAYPETVRALLEHPMSEEPCHSGYALANKASSFYDFLSKHPIRAKRFATIMNSQDSSLLSFLSTAFPWSTLPSNTLIIDLGGSQGHASAHLASQFPQIKFLVQDLPEVVTDDHSTFSIPESLSDRVTLMPHNFLEPQPVENVDLFLLRYILHNWSDSYSIKILRNLIPVLKNGAKILVQDTILPEPKQLPIDQERGIRALDCSMLTLFNAHERELADWVTLLSEADERFKFVDAKYQENGDGLLIFVWTG